MSTLSVLVLFSSVLGQAAAKPDAEMAAAEKAFAECKKLVGGVWQGKLANDMPVRFTFRLIENGKVILGEGTVGDPKKPVMEMKSHIGIDLTAKKVYYLDQHGANTVYFGHFTSDAPGRLTLEFKGISTDTGTYRSTVQLPDGNQYLSKLFVVEAPGKERLLHGLDMKREG